MAGRWSVSGSGGGGNYQYAVAAKAQGWWVGEVHGGVVPEGGSMEVGSNWIARVA